MHEEVKVKVKVTVTATVTVRCTEPCRTCLLDVRSEGVSVQGAVEGVLVDAANEALLFRVLSPARCGGVR